MVCFLPFTHVGQGHALESWDTLQQAKAGGTRALPTTAKMEQSLKHMADFQTCSLQC